MNITKRLEETISKSEEDEDEVPATPDASHDAVQLLRVGSSSDIVPPFPAKPPGRVLFSHQASFLTEVYPPGLDMMVAPARPLEQLLTLDNHLMLRDAVVTGLLSLCFRDRPCPSSVWAWLFQLMCRSHDSVLCKASFKVLNDLAVTARQCGFGVCCPLVVDIQDALVGLGANREMVLGTLACEDLESDGANDVFVPATPPQVSHLHLTCLLRFLSSCVQFSPTSYSSDELRRLVLLLAKVSLDPGVCGTLIHSHLAQCVGTLLQTIPGDAWGEVMAQLCAGLGGLTRHHHNQLYIAQVISAVSDRQEQLVRLYVKHCIGQITGVDLSREDIDFAQSVLLYYYKMKASQYDYYQMFSVLKMLNLYLPPSKMKWESSESKQKFTRLLACFASQLKDRVSLNLEITVVKSYVMDIKTELDSQIVSDGPRQQTLPF